MKLAATCLLLCLGASLGAPTPEPATCCMPEQFEGKISLTVGMVPVSGAAWNQGFLSEGTIHWDYKNSKTAVVQELNYGEFKVANRVVQDLANKKMYVIDAPNKKCTVYPTAGLLSTPNEAVRPGCQSRNDNQKDLGKRNLGWEKDTLQVQAYETEVAQPPMIIKTYMTTTCMPVATQFTGIFNNVKMVQGQVYSDLAKGIKDPSVFVIPDYCPRQDTPDQATMEALNHVFAGHIAGHVMYT